MQGALAACISHTAFPTTLPTFHHHLPPPPPPPPPRFATTAAGHHLHLFERDNGRQLGRGRVETRRAKSWYVPSYPSLPLTTPTTMLLLLPRPHHHLVTASPPPPPCYRITTTTIIIITIITTITTKSPRHHPANHMTTSSGEGVNKLREERGAESRESVGRERAERAQGYIHPHFTSISLTPAVSPPPVQSTVDEYYSPPIQ
jgi:hypothetical protein